jgi:hypothetical protein
MWHGQRELSHQLNYDVEADTQTLNGPKLTIAAQTAETEVLEGFLSESGYVGSSHWSVILETVRLPATSYISEPMTSSDSRNQVDNDLSSGP